MPPSSPLLLTFVSSFPKLLNPASNARYLQGFTLNTVWDAWTVPLSVGVHCTVEGVGFPDF